MQEHVLLVCAKLHNRAVDRGEFDKVVHHAGDIMGTHDDQILQAALGRRRNHLGRAAMVDMMPFVASAVELTDEAAAWEPRILDENTAAARPNPLATARGCTELDPSRRFLVYVVSSLCASCGSRNH